MPIARAPASCNLVTLDVWRRMCRVNLTFPVLEMYYIALAIMQACAG